MKTTRRMKFIYGIIPFVKNSDDVYLIPTIAIGNSNTKDGGGVGIGIKFLKLIIAVGVAFEKGGQ